MKKFIFLAGLGIGFVIGSRAGRGPYESLERTARQVAEDPEVQRRAAQARDTATRVAHDTAETVKDKAPGVAAGVQEKVSSAAGAAKDRVTGEAKNEKNLAEKSADSATSGGDAEVGEDKPLGS
ncbi:hypothetical protein [Brachybacterium sp. Marseille-Q7125]|uniref:hypothetical protein n=1 Tax=Brachybacterium sp. Marseille-Q7125 TaxID=2932815 RepID=UPI001FF335DD|nr:hypothetical protein [Brachybacterium sp. Marseille-Q7125]